MAATKISCREQLLRVTVFNEYTDEPLSLNFPGSYTVLQLKDAVAIYTGIPEPRQDWTGWPSGVQNDITLNRLGLQDDSVLLVKPSY